MDLPPDGPAPEGLCPTARMTLVLGLLRRITAANTCLLRLEEENGAVAEVEVDEVLRLCGRRWRSVSYSRGVPRSMTDHG
jgi:hypothetical protein